MPPAIAAAAITAGASIYSANKNADAVKEANSGDLPDWLRPYITGQGPQPESMQGPPRLNTQWLDYITRLGQGDHTAPWAPMTAHSPWFNPEMTFDPGAPSAENPYGTAPAAGERNVMVNPPLGQPGGGVSGVPVSAMAFNANYGTPGIGVEGLWNSGAFMPEGVPRGAQASDFIQRGDGSYLYIGEGFQ